MSTIFRGPTRGYHVNVWAYLLELLVSSAFVVLSVDGGLTAHDADRFAQKSVWPVATIREAFRHLTQLGLVSFERQEGGAMTAAANLARLRGLLRQERELEQRGKTESRDIPVLHYFRSRRLCARVHWLDRLITPVEDEEVERERS